ncbi:uncharacterized protein DS421_10g302860 [Arachis hypogaea]|nr:uncharacterized protein DS421_10g302860 [Arachis hypogaea]
MTNTTITVSLLVLLTVSYVVVHVLCDDRKAERLYVEAPRSLAHVAVAPTVASVMVWALRAIIVTWVTVLVLPIEFCWKSPQDSSSTR